MCHFSRGARVWKRICMACQWWTTFQRDFNSKPIERGTEREREGQRSRAPCKCVLCFEFAILRILCRACTFTVVCGVAWCGDGVPADCLIDIIKYLAIFRISFRFCYWQIWHAFCPKLAFGQGCNGQCSCRHQLTIFLASFSVYELGPKPQSHSHTQTHSHTSQQVSLLCCRYRIHLNSQRYWLSLVQFSTSPLAVRLLLPAWSQWVIRRPYR